MSQKARPVSDTANTGWTPTPLYNRLNDLGSPADPDPTFVESPSNPVGSKFEVKLASLIWPPCSATDPPNPAKPCTLLVKVRWRNTDAANQVPVSVVLLQGSTVIAAKLVTPGVAFQEETLEVKDPQLALITDYSQLSVRVIAGNITVPCCPTVPLPSILHATLTSNVFDHCPCIGGSFPLAYDTAIGTSGGWRGTGDSGCGYLLTVTFRCSGGFVLDTLYGNPCLNPPGTGIPNVGSPSCAPLNAVFNSGVLMPVGCGCVGGGFYITVTL